LDIWNLNKLLGELQENAVMSTGANCFHSKTSQVSGQRWIPFLSFKMF
jgi:hypothetical protein